MYPVEFIKKSTHPEILALSWQQQLAHAITEPAQLLQALNLKTEDFDNCLAATQQFSLKIPHAYVSKMQSANSLDPFTAASDGSVSGNIANRRLQQRPRGRFSC